MSGSQCCDEGNVRKYSPNNTASHHIGPVSSTRLCIRKYESKRAVFASNNVQFYHTCSITSPGQLSSQTDIFIIMSTA